MIPYIFPLVSYTTVSLPWGKQMKHYNSEWWLILCLLQQSIKGTNMYVTFTIEFSVATFRRFQFRLEKKISNMQDSHKHDCFAFPVLCYSCLTILGKTRNHFISVVLLTFMVFTTIQLLISFICLSTHPFIHPSSIIYHVSLGAEY